MPIAQAYLEAGFRGSELRSWLRLAMVMLAEIEASS